MCPDQPLRANILGNVVRTLREHLDLSLEALGLAADLHRHYVAGVAGGERNQSFESLSRWFATVKVSTGETLGTHWTSNKSGDFSQTGLPT